MKTKKLMSLLSWTAFVWILAGSFANAALISITTSDGNGADAHIWVAAPNSNYGVGEAIGVKNDTAFPGNNRKGFLKFDYSFGSALITDAVLELVYSGTNAPDTPANPSTYHIYGLNNGHAGENWADNSITWNNAPGHNTGSAGVLASETTYLGNFNINFSITQVGDTISFATQELTDFLNTDTDGLVTFIITRGQRNFSIEYFASKENTNGWAAPTLNINQVPLSPAWFYLVSGIWVAAKTARRKYRP